MSTVTAGEALGYGFINYYSVWQACIAQISPFFLAHMAALYLSEPRATAGPLSRSVQVPAWFFLPGFALSFAVINSISFTFSEFLFNNMNVIRVIAGGYIFLSGSYFIMLVGRPSWRRGDIPWLRALATFMLGVGFAVVYMPCISPTLSKILSLSLRPASADIGAYYALLYATGLSLAFLLTGTVLLFLLRRVKNSSRRTRVAIGLCGVLVALLGLMNITGLMVHYKALLLSIFET